MTLTRKSTHIVFLTAAFFLACLFNMRTAQAQYSEYEVKSAMILNFAKYIEWPPNVFDKDGKIIIGILGDDPISNDLREVLKGRTVKGRGLEIITSATVDGLKGAHIIFISKGNSFRTKQVLEEIYSRRRSHVVTIGDGLENFCQLGGMINYLPGSYLFEINMSAFTNAGLIVDVSLINFAKAIVDYDK